MALNKTLCANEIVAKLKARTPGMSTEQEELARAVWSDIVDALFEHMKANMVVTSSVNVDSVTLVTPGTGVSGPGTGTATSTTIQ